MRTYNQYNIIKINYENKRRVYFLRIAAQSAGRSSKRTEGVTRDTFVITSAEMAEKQE